MNVQTNFQKTTQVLLRIAAISTAALAIFGVYTFYRNEIWHPHIVIQRVDYANGVAELVIDGKAFLLKGDSEYLISYDWGIKFGSTTKDGKRIYDRIEITKRGKVKTILR
jgi:hypothetical protein